jgi:hypothetical protein
MRGSVCALAASLWLALAGVGASSVRAECRTLAFSVNDYGQEGPKRDALAKLDGHIAAWTTGKGIRAYRTGRKDVTCRVFLDVGLFDEWTCTAKARVCW